MTLVEIEQQRQRRKISVARLCAASGVDARTYFRMRRGEQSPRADTLAKLAAGLASAVKGERASRTELVFRMVCGQLAYERELDVRRLIDHKPQLKATSDPKWSEIQQLRDIAIYLLHAVLGIANVEVARVAGIKPAAVTYAVQRVEMRRDDPALDRMFDALEQAVAG